MVKGRLRHAHEHIVSIKDDPTACLIRYFEGSYRVDLFIDDRYVECEPLVNDLEQAICMCKALHEAQSEIMIIVPNTHNALAIMPSKLATRLQPQNEDSSCR